MLLSSCTTQALTHADLVDRNLPLSLIETLQLSLMDQSGRPTFARNLLRRDSMNDVSCEMPHPADNIVDAWGKLTIDPLAPGDPRYVDCSVVRGINVVNLLGHQLDLYKGEGRYMHQLFTGYRGDGKSTELKRLMNRIDEEYFPLYFEAEKEFDLNDLEFSEFLLGVATAVYNRMDQNGLELPEDLQRDVADWFGAVVQTVEQRTSAELKGEIGAGGSWFGFITAKLLGTIKAGGERRTEVRREFNKNLVQLIEHVDRLLFAAGGICKENKGKGLVIIMDNLDRLTPDLAFNLFYTNGQKLCMLRCHFIYVVPISLIYDPKATLLPYPDPPVKMKMIPVYTRNGEEDEIILGLLRKVLERRFVPDKILSDPDAIMRNFMLASGGHLRDLVRFFRQACSAAMSDPEQKITAKIAKRVLNEACESYQRTITGENDYDYLLETYRTKEVKSDATVRRLLFDNLILVYDDEGTDWYNVHPVLAQGKAFQSRLCVQSRPPKG